MQDWNEMQLLARVGVRRNLTRAAEDLGLPKSTVSRGLTRLEERLGLRLVERTTRRVRLTEVGERYAEAAAQMALLAEAAERDVLEAGKTPQGLLRVSSPATLLRSYLSPGLGEFLLRYPKLRVEFLPPGTKEVDVYLRAGTLPEDTPLRLKRLGRVRVGLYASPQYLQRQGLPGRPEELQSHALLGVSRKVSWWLESGKKRLEVTGEARLTAPDPVVLLEAAVQGLGVTVAPLWMAAEALGAGGLVRILTQWEAEPVELMALYGEAVARVPKVRVFLDFVGQAVAATRESGMA